MKEEQLGKTFSKQQLVEPLIQPKMVVKQSHQESIEHVDGTIACLSPNQVDVLFILFKEREK